MGSLPSSRPIKKESSGAVIVCRSCHQNLRPGSVQRHDGSCEKYAVIIPVLVYFETLISAVKTSCWGISQYLGSYVTPRRPPRPPDRFQKHLSECKTSHPHPRARASTLLSDPPFGRFYKQVKRSPQRRDFSPPPQNHRRRKKQSAFHICVKNSFTLRRQTCHRLPFV